MLLVIIVSYFFFKRWYVLIVVMKLLWKRIIFLFDLSKMANCKYNSLGMKNRLLFQIRMINYKLVISSDVLLFLFIIQCFKAWSSFTLSLSVVVLKYVLFSWSFLSYTLNANLLIFAYIITDGLLRKIQ